MDELDKGLDICVKGDVRERALAAFHQQITAWNVAMPPVEPLVLDFGLGDFDHTGLIEYWIANGSVPAALAMQPCGTPGCTGRVA